MSQARRVGQLAIVAILAATALLGSGAAPAAARTVDAGASRTGDVSPAGATHYPVTLTEMSIQTGWTFLAAGPVVLDIRNAGTVTHELVVLRTTILPDAIPARANDPSKAEEVGDIAEAEDIAPGTSASLSLTLSPGHYVLICNEPGHYKAGMHVGFTAASFVGVKMTEMSVTLDRASIPYGPVVFNVTSTGGIEHELVLLQTGALPENVPVDANKKASEDTDVFEIDPILPGTFSGGVTELDPGWYVVICNKPGHFLAGMRTRLEVTPAQVDVGLTEMSMKPDTIVVPAGYVDFSVSNGGTVEHELVVAATSVGDGLLPPGDEAGTVSEVGWIGETGDMKAHSFSGLELYLPAGTYAVFCNEPGHYKAGMHFILTVE